MKTHRFLVLLICAMHAALPGQLRAAEPQGTVRSVNGDTILVAMTGDVMPPVGAKAEIFFKLAGSDEEISVAIGRALKIEQGDLAVKIELASGSVEKGQFVRFTSGQSGGAPPVATPAKARGSIVGDWKRKYQEASMTFKPDGTVDIVEGRGRTSAKYRLDDKQTPHHLDVFDIKDDKGKAVSGNVIMGIYEMQPDGRLKFEADAGGLLGKRPEQFTKDASIGTRVEPLPAGSAPTIVGSWLREIGLDERYRFTADGGVQHSFQMADQAPQVNEYKYTVNAGASPSQINFYMDEVKGNPGYRGIFEIAADDRLRLEGKWATKDESERPKEMDENTGEFLREPWANAPPR